MGVCNNYRTFSKGSKAGPLQAGQQLSFLSPRLCFMEQFGQEVLLFLCHVAGRVPGPAGRPPPIPLPAPSLPLSGRLGGDGATARGQALSLCANFDFLLYSLRETLASERAPCHLGKIFKGNGSKIGRAACA